MTAALAIRDRSDRWFRRWGSTWVRLGIGGLISLADDNDRFVVVVLRQEFDLRLFAQHTLFEREVRRNAPHAGERERATYSVWRTWAGLTLTAYVGVDTVEIAGPKGRVKHPIEPIIDRFLEANP